MSGLGWLNAADSGNWADAVPRTGHRTGCRRGRLGRGWGVHSQTHGHAVARSKVPLTPPEGVDEAPVTVRAPGLGRVRWTVL